MRRSTADELARDPVGRYVAGEGFVHFCAAPTLWGVILWGRHDQHSALALGRTLVLELAPPAVRHASIIDASRLEGGDAIAFDAARRYLTDFGPALEKWIERLAMVRPDGLGGALVAGAYQVLPRPYPVAVFEDAAEAMVWLADPPGPGWPADRGAFLDELHGEATGVTPVVGALRGFLDGHLVGADIATAARAVGVSERSLQRKLAEAGTTFTDELAEARVRVARSLLVDGDAPLTAIAFEVGCASLQHFSALFRKRTGEAPSDFRRRHRRSG